VEAEWRQNFEAIRKREDNMKMAAEQAERELDELGDRYDELLADHNAEVGKLRGELDDVKRART
jgi:hypothetical protein